MDSISWIVLGIFLAYVALREVFSAWNIRRIKKEYRELGRQDVRIELMENSFSAIKKVQEIRQKNEKLNPTELVDAITDNGVQPVSDSKN